MGQISVDLDPSGDHSTASVTSKILNSGAADTSASGFKVGSLSTGSGYNLITSIFGNLPDKTDIYGNDDLQTATLSAWVYVDNAPSLETIVSS